MLNVDWWLSNMIEQGMHSVGTLEKRRSVDRVARLIGVGLNTNVHFTFTYATCMVMFSKPVAKHRLSASTYIICTISIAMVSSSLSLIFIVTPIFLSGRQWFAHCGVLRHGQRCAPGDDIEAKSGGWLEHLKYARRPARIHNMYLLQSNFVFVRTMLAPSNPSRGGPISIQGYSVEYPNILRNIYLY
jgi:hypothetical protein